MVSAFVFDIEIRKMTLLGNVMLCYTSNCSKTVVDQGLFRQSQRRYRSWSRTFNEVSEFRNH